MSDHASPSASRETVATSSPGATVVNTDEEANKRPTTRSLDSIAHEHQQPQRQPPYSIYSPWQKRAMVLGAALTAFFSPLTAQIYLPALPSIARDLHVTSSQVNLTITTYMIFQGICPMFVGSLADSGGRRPAYLFCFVLYIAANIGVALAPNYGAVLGLRCLQSAGSSSTVALCTAVVADIVTSAERGQYVSFTAVPSVLAPALGPVIGGLLSQRLGWRSIFWFLTIFAGVTILVHAMFFPETCRHIVGDGSVEAPLIYQSGWQILRRRRKNKANVSSDSSEKRQPYKNEAKFKFKAPNVLDSLFMLFEIETGLLLGSSSIVFAGLYCVLTAMPAQLKERYGLDEITIGLMYLPLAAGTVCSVLVTGPLINRNYKRHCAKLGIPYDRSRQMDLSEFPIEHARLDVGMPLLVLAAVSIIAWGWALHASAHIAVLCVLSVILGLGLNGFNNTSNVLLVDIQQGKAGTATAANNLTRCLLGAGATAAISPLISAITVGGAFSLLGGLCFLCMGPLLLLRMRGMKWRQELKRRRELKEQEKRERAIEGVI